MAELISLSLAELADLTAATLTGCGIIGSPVIGSLGARSESLLEPPEKIVKCFYLRSKHVIVA